MSRSRQRALIVAVGLAGSVGVASLLAALGQWVGVTVVLGILLGLGVWVGIDLRARTADLAHMLRLAADRQRQAAGAIRSGETAASAAREEAAAARNAVDGAARTLHGLADRVEVAERRLLSVVEATRLGADDHHRELATRIEHLLPEIVTRIDDQGSRARDATAHAGKSIVRELTAVSRDQTREVEALMQLLPRIAPRAPMPPSGRWAMNARSLLHLAHLVETKRPRQVVELGGGTSTVWLAYLLDGTGSQVVSVDHDAQFSALTREALARHGLEAAVDVRTAPLSGIELDGEVYEWYDVAAFEGVESIDLLVVDGPPGSGSAMARYPALPALGNKLARDAWVVLDDSDRPDEAAIVQRWQEENPNLELVDQGLSRLAVLR